MRLPRPVLVIRLVITLALALGVLAMSSTPSFSYPGIAKDNHGHNGKSENRGKGHKNKGKHEDNGKHKGKDKDKKEKKAKKVKAEPLAAYVVHAECSYEPTSDQTTCDFDADSPAGAKKINLLDLPSDEICAPVVGGDARYVDPDPNTGATGYRSTDPEGKFTLVFSGRVTAGGTATYWIKAAKDIFPAKGMGLRCASQQEAAAPTPATTATVVTSAPTATATPIVPEVTDTTGSVVVRAYDCPIASPPADYDWYGQCTPVTAGSRYRLMRLDSATRDGITTSTDSAGRAIFRSLPPGTYQLTQTDGDWCHAQSDDVNADGNLIVKAGDRTSVWVFTCASTP
jgi:hypothetical protein